MKVFNYAKFGLFCLSVILAGCATRQPVQMIQPVQEGTQLLSYEEDKKGEEVFPLHRHTEGEKRFVFDPNASAWAAYDASGRRIKTGRASGGVDYCPELHKACHTIVGTFRVYEKKGPGCVSSKFPLGKGGAPMPYCMFFHGGYAIHGSNYVPNKTSSHGCIRLFPSAAKWLSENFMAIGTRVEVLPYRAHHHVSD